MTDEAKALVERLQSPALVFLTDTPASASILSKLGREARDLIETQAREIEQIVAWLRDKWDGGLVEPILDAIEAGEYRNG